MHQVGIKVGNLQVSFAMALSSLILQTEFLAAFFPKSTYSSHWLFVFWMG